jgi:Ca-activated chloride channel homolog
MYFEHPDYLSFLAVVPVLFFFTWLWWHWRKKAIAALGRPSAVQQLLPPFSAFRFWWRQGCLLVAIALLIVAAANPRTIGVQKTVAQESSDVMILLDISNSMLAEDSKPSRIELARQFAQKLVKALEGERIGLIFFAGNAYLQVPLSTDYPFMIQSLQAAEPGLVTTQGTAIAEAVRLAQASFDAETGAGRALIIITDGENHDTEAVDAVKDAFSEGIVTLAVGAGTAEGGFIPMETSGNARYKRDEQGEVVRSRLNEQLLRDLAAAGGGSAFLLRDADRTVNAIQKNIADLAKRRILVPASSNLETRYQWFLLPAIFLLLLSGGWRRL